jgi:deoxyribose-phosphate aldolase
METLTSADLAARLDHSVLRPDAVPADIARACAEAREYRMFAVCVAPVFVGLAAQELAGCAVKVVSVIGFPHGNTLPRAKAAEARLALEAGAGELDMVLQVGALKSGDTDLVLQDIRGVVEAARERGALVKVILETALLDDAEKRLACRLAEEAGADFVKTSTGFGPGGATEADVRLLRATVGDRLGVKASGGIRNLEQALAMIRAGADRLGASASVGMLRELAAAQH